MNILMVGPHKDKVNGGMSTVIKEYTNSKYLKEFNIQNIHTVVPGSKVKKILFKSRSFHKHLQGCHQPGKPGKPGKVREFHFP